MNNISKGALILIIIISISSLYAQDSTISQKENERSSVRKITLGSDSSGLGWDGSTLTNVGSFFFNGDYSLFSAGLGFGMSYKMESRHHRYPYEIGLYIAPQFASSKQGDVAFVSGLIHFTCFKAFGIGLGYRFWNKGEGFVEWGKNNIFFTLGYNLTNEKTQ
jgi:hypothetical protein